MPSTISALYTCTHKHSALMQHTINPPAPAMPAHPIGQRTILSSHISRLIPHATHSGRYSAHLSPRSQRHTGIASTRARHGLPQTSKACPAGHSEPRHWGRRRGSEIPTGWLTTDDSTDTDGTLTLAARLPPKTWLRLGSSSKHSLPLHFFHSPPPAARTSTSLFFFVASSFFRFVFAPEIAIEFHSPILERLVVFFVVRRCSSVELIAFALPALRCGSSGSQTGRQSSCPEASAPPRHGSEIFLPPRLYSPPSPPLQDESTIL